MRSAYAQLAKLVLITSFGRGASRPLRSAILRICLATTGAISLGVVLGRSLAGAQLATGLPALLLAAGITTIAFAVSGFILLSAGSLTLQSSGSTVQRLLTILPLYKLARWFVLVLPFAVMSLILLCLYVPLSIGLAHSSGTPVMVCLAAALLGTLASIGFVLLRVGNMALVKTGLFTLMVFGMVWQIDSAIKSASQRVSALLLWLVLVLALAVLSGLVQSYRRPVSFGRTGRVMKRHFVWPERLVVPLWFVIKTLRNRHALVAYGFCLFVSISLAAGLQLRHQVSLAGVGWLIFGSVLACSFASDFRGLSRRHKTPEIVALKGVPYFMLQQLAAALVLNALVVAPLWLVVVFGSPLAVSTLLLYTVGIVMAGTVLGLLSSTLFVPQNGELGSQIFTALTAFIGLFGLPRAFKFAGLSLPAQAFIWLGIAAVCFLGALVIEHLRRRNYIHAGA